MTVRKPLVNVNGEIEQLVSGDSLGISLENSDLTDVILDNPQIGQVLVYDGEKWTNSTIGGGGSVYPKYAVITSSQTWTLPATALPMVKYDIIGGGAGADGRNGSNVNNAIIGGGGGGRRRGTINLTPGNSYPIVIGANGMGANLTQGSQSSPTAGRQ